MQIRNDYHPQQGQTYSQSHTHYMTECLHEEKEKRKTEAPAKSVSSYQKGDAAKAAVEYVASFSVEGMSVNAGKKKPGMIRRFWDSLGDSGESVKGIDLRQTALNGVHAATVAIQGFWERRIVKPVTGAKDKAKTIPSQAMRQFGKGKEAFGALLNGGMKFSGGNSKEKEQKKDVQIKAGQPENHHLMDSYNKSGDYCRLHENLTYQKPKETRERR